MLVSCGKTSNTIDGDMVTNVVQHVASVISQETDTSYLASLFKCATDCLRVWGDVKAETRVALENASKQQLQVEDAWVVGYEPSAVDGDLEREGSGAGPWGVGQ